MMHWIRQRFVNFSIRQKLTTIILLTVACSLAIACVTFVIVDVFLLRSRVRRDLVASAQVIGLNSTAALTFGDHDSATEVLKAFRAKPSILGAALYSADGSRFASYVSDKGAGVPPRARPDEVVFEGANVHIFQGIELDGKQVGSIYIVSDLRYVRMALQLYAMASVAILLGALALAWLIASRLQRVVSDPIIELAGIADEVTQRKNYGLRATPRRRSGHDEVSNLVHCFNEMLSEIQRRDASLENEVAARTHELQMILDTAGEGIFGIDGRGMVTFINPAGARMLGALPEQLIGRCCHDFLHTSSDSLPPGPLASCSVCSCTLLPVTRISRTSSFRRAPGLSFPVDYTVATMVSESGRATGLVVTFRDITERQAVERMKSEFVSTVSHELRTPLTSIRGALGLLGGGLLGAVGEKGQRMLDIAVNNTDRLVRLINDILDLERMESGRVELHHKLVDAADLLQQTADGMQALADRAGLRLVVDAPAQPLSADPDRIIQTLTNLVSNAVKFSPRGSTVTLSARVQGNMMAFSVADQGRGIPHDKLESVFERFQQVDASDSREKGGTGLGLAICRSIVAAHGGRIWVESAEGIGSVFHVTLPLAGSQLVEEPESCPQQLAAPEFSSLSRRPTVLVVEDDLDLARIVTTSLDAHGIRTIHAADGRAAVEAVRVEEPDLIVLDLVLPKMDGFAIVEYLKRNHILERIPLVVYSALEIDQTQRERLRLGPTEFLTKSRTTPEEFEVRVIRLLHGLSAVKEVAGAA